MRDIVTLRYAVIDEKGAAPAPVPKHGRLDWGNTRWHERCRVRAGGRGAIFEIKDGCPSRRCLLIGRNASEGMLEACCA